MAFVVIMLVLGVLFIFGSEILTFLFDCNRLLAPLFTPVVLAVLLILGIVLNKICQKNFSISPKTRRRWKNKREAMRIVMMLYNFISAVIIFIVLFDRLLMRFHTSWDNLLWGAGSAIIKFLRYVGLLIIVIAFIVYVSERKKQKRIGKVLRYKEGFTDYVDEQRY